MAIINITIPDAVMPRVLDAFAAQYGFDPGGGQTKGQFAKARILDHVKAITKAHEVSVAADAARDEAAAKVDDDILLS